MDLPARQSAWLWEALRVRINNPALLQMALTHRSAAKANNERLEFIGDAFIGVCVAQYLYERFTTADEGGLSRLRARVVSGEALAQVAMGIGLGEQLLLGAGELKTGGFRRESILADALEALVGAVFLDAGFDAARQAVLHLLRDSLAALDVPTELKDAKTLLQEWLQGRGLGLPRYTVDAIEGELHAPQFRVSCVVEAFKATTTAVGSSRNRAERLAAAAMLEQVENKQ